MLEKHRRRVEARAAMGIPSLPSDSAQPAAPIEFLKTIPAGVEIS